MRAAEEKETGMHLSTGFTIYIGLWSTTCLVAIGVCVGGRVWHAIVRPDYWKFLFAPWKVTTFAVALAGMVWLGPRSGDPTWDAVDALFMSALTYLGAPWSVGTLARSTRRRKAWQQVLVAGCLWMFSASWSYDLYILLRDGGYPATWLANMAASSVLYALAGLLWNLEWTAKRGTSLGFLREEWPSPATYCSCARVLLVALPIMLLVAALMLGFFRHGQDRGIRRGPVAPVAPAFGPGPL
jgi:hypothetical protein